MVMQQTRPVIDWSSDHKVRIHGVVRLRLAPDIDRLFDFLYESAKNASDVREANARVRKAALGLVHAAYGPAPRKGTRRQIEIIPGIDRMISNHKRAGGYGQDWEQLNDMIVEGAVAHIHAECCEGHYNHCYAPPELGDGPALGVAMELRSHRRSLLPQDVD